MKKLLFTVLTVTFILGFTACSKPEVEPVHELPVSATLIRNIDYTIRGTSRDTIYTDADKIVTGAGYSFKTLQDKDANTFYVSIDAGPFIANTYGENVIFVIDKATLKPGFVGEYSIDQQAANPVYDVTYAYSYKSDNGGISANLHNLRMGLQMAGELKIEGYDAIRKTISGSYAIAANLDQDPLKMTRAVEFDEKCKLTVSGTFKNVKIKQD